MFDYLPYPAILAHRGDSAHAPENTMAAFELALRQGADGFELDAKLSGDGQVVVIHDQTVDRTTQGSGRVREMKLAELRELDAGSHFDVAFKGELIPTLDEVFAAFGKETFINVELTNYASPFDALPEKVAELVKRHDLSQRILFSSFNPVALRRIHRLAPGTAIGLLAFKGGKGALARGRAGKVLVPYHSLHLNLADVTAQLIRRVHQAGDRVLVYTVNLADDMRRLFSMTVDGIISDDPLLARQILKTENS